MDQKISIVVDPAFENDDKAYIINGKLHVSPQWTRSIETEEYLKKKILKSSIIDVDELMYVSNLDSTVLFAGQQVKVHNNGFYLGDATITCYPYNMQLQQAEVSMHSPVKGEVMICSVDDLEPISE